MTNFKEQFEQFNNKILQTHSLQTTDGEVYINPIGLFVDSFVQTHNEFPEEVIEEIATDITRVIVNCFNFKAYLNDQNIDHIPLWESSLKIMNQAISSKETTQKDLLTGEFLQGFQEKCEENPEKVISFIGLFPDFEGKIGSTMKSIISELVSDHAHCNPDTLREYCTDILFTQAQFAAQEVGDLIMGNRQVAQEVAHMNHIIVDGEEVVRPAPAPSSVHVIPMSPRQLQQG